MLSVCNYRHTFTPDDPWSSHRSRQIWAILEVLGHHDLSGLENFENSENLKFKLIHPFQLIPHTFVFIER